MYTEKELCELFDNIITKEGVLNPQIGRLSVSANEIYGLTWQLLEYAKNIHLLRIYANTYHMTEDKIAYPSVAAHTNLMSAIVEGVIDLTCGEEGTKEAYGYSYGEILKAARRHDLPENEFGDIEDNGDRDDEGKAIEEKAYWKKFASHSPVRCMATEEHVYKILLLHQNREGKLGKMLHLADKLSAILETLSYDEVGLSPTKSIHDPDLSEKDKRAMEICDCGEYGLCKASEMWTIQFAKLQQTITHDDSGIFTAIIIMATFIINAKWYNWRHEDYKQITP